MVKTLFEEFNSHIVYDLSMPDALARGIETVGIKLSSWPTKEWDIFAVVQRYEWEEKTILTKFYDTFEDIPYWEYGVCDSERGFEFRYRPEPEDMWI